MSFRERMHPAVSRLEEAVFQRLSELHLTGAMVTQKPIVLRQTLPDFWWIQKRKVLFLDGEQVHQDKQELDEEIQNMLEAMGFSVLRITYKPVSGVEANRRLAEKIVDEQVKEFLGVTDE